MKTLIVMVGLPRSGKSTYSRKLKQPIVSEALGHFLEG